MNVFRFCIHNHFVANFATTTPHGAIKGKTQTINVEHYNLDVIISVGYRVKSFRGTQFRRWANQVLKSYILKGYAVNSRFEHLENRVTETEKKILSKRSADVNAKIYTKKISEQLQLDLAKHNLQYEPIYVEKSDTFHDRFLIIDDVVYHIGASLKDLGKKLFAFSKMEITHSEFVGRVAVI